MLMQMAVTMGADFAFDPIAAEADGNRPADIIKEQTRGEGVMMCMEAAAAGTIDPETLTIARAALEAGWTIDPVVVRDDDEFRVGELSQAGPEAHHDPARMPDILLADADHRDPGLNQKCFAFFFGH